MNNAPQGRPSASVYRRRRIVVAVLGLLLVGLLIWGVSAVLGAIRGDGEPASTPQGGQGPAASGEASQQATEEPGQMCAEHEVGLSTSTDQKSYTEQQDPVLILEIKNVSDRDCTLNVGTTQQEFLVMSGSDRIFSTADCAAAGEDVELEFKAGQEESARFTWQRARSAPGCKEVNMQPRPGTYKFTAKLGEYETEPVSFELK